MFWLEHAGTPYSQELYCDWVEDTFPDAPRPHAGTGKAIASAVLHDVDFTDYKELSRALYEKFATLPGSFAKIAKAANLTAKSPYDDLCHLVRHYIHTRVGGDSTAVLLDDTASPAQRFAIRVWREMGLDREVPTKTALKAHFCGGYGEHAPSIRQYVAHEDPIITDDYRAPLPLPPKANLLKMSVREIVDRAQAVIAEALAELQTADENEATAQEEADAKANTRAPVRLTSEHTKPMVAAARKVFGATLADDLAALVRGDRDPVILQTLQKALGGKVAAIRKTLKLAKLDFPSGADARALTVFVRDHLIEVAGIKV